MFDAAPTLTPRSEGEFRDFVAVPSPEEVDALRFEDNIVPVSYKTDPWKMPEPVHYTPDMTATWSQSQSMYTDTTATHSDDDLSRSMLDSVTRQSPPTKTKTKVMTNNTPIADAKNERRYRYLLEHEFNSSCASFCCRC